MSKNIKQIKPLKSSSTSVVAFSFLAALQFSACLAKQGQGLRDGEIHVSSTDLVPLTQSLKVLEEQRRRGAKNSQEAFLQDAFVEAVRYGNASRVQALLKEPSLNVNDGGIFVSDDHFNSAKAQWDINNAQIRQGQRSPRPSSDLSKESIRFVQANEIQNIESPNIEINSFRELDLIQQRVHVPSLILAAKAAKTPKTFRTPETFRTPKAVKLDETAENEHEKVFKLLVEAKDIDIRTSDPESGFSLLNLVVKNRWATLAEYLISQLDRDELLAQYKDKRGTPLHFALSRKLRRSVIQRLINKLPQKALADLDEAGNTPLHLAIKSRSADIVSDLVNKMAEEDLSIKNKDGKTALELAISLGRLTSLQKLLTKLRGDDVSQGLMFAFGRYSDPKLSEGRQYSDPKMLFKNRTKEMVRLLLTKGSHNDSLGEIKDIEGRTLLHLAIKHGDPAAAKLLRNKVRSSSLASKDTKGQTALHLSICTEFDYITDFLIDNFSQEDLLSADENGNTPLHLAVLYRKQDKFDRILASIDRDLLIKKLFEQNKDGRSLFASAFLPSCEKKSFLPNSGKLSESFKGVFSSANYKMFKHIIDQLASSLIQEECVAIVNEIDDMAFKHLISNSYARSLRCLLSPFVKEKADETGLRISRYNSYTRRKAPETQRVHFAKESSLERPVDEGYQSTSTISLLCDLSSSTPSKSEEAITPFTSSPLSENQPIVSKPVVVPTASFGDQNLSPIRKAPVLPAKRSSIKPNGGAVNNAPAFSANLSSSPVSPPIPSFPLPTKTVDKVHQKVQVEVSSSSKATDDRSALMEQIRATGSGTLKRPKERKIPEKKVPGAPQNLMADLFRNLANRRLAMDNTLDISSVDRASDQESEWKG